jgi:hypothetical protein
MERFARKYRDDRISRRLLGSIQGKGAFRRFKDTVFDLGIQDEWNEFRANEFEEIACAVVRAGGNSIHERRCDRADFGERDVIQGCAADLSQGLDDYKQAGAR